MWLRGWLGYCLLELCIACAAVAPARLPPEPIAIPERAQVYLAETRPDGAIGGPGVEQLEADVRRELIRRGAQPEADGALSAAAAWALREIYQGRKLDILSTETVTRWFGFGGVVLSFAAFDMRTPGDWRAALAMVPSNVAVTRYGILVSPKGRAGAIVLGHMRATYEPINRRSQPGESVTLKGEVDARHRACQVFLTKPDGTVEQRDIAGRAFDASFSLEQRGKYRLEIIGIDEHGPAIVSNLPLYVGVPEPSITAPTGATLDPEKAEQRLLALLNQARAAAGAPAVRSDAELRAIALAHTEDMIAEKFFAHNSPRTGAPEDRARKAGVLVSIVGENIGMGATPELVHEGLMESPGHRLNMLRPEFTHVGIAAKNGEVGLVVTMNFGRRPKPADVPTTTLQVINALQSLRASRGLPAVTLDPVYGPAAQAGAEMLAAGESTERMTQAIDVTAQRQVNRLRTSRPANCVYQSELLELAQLSNMPPLLSAQLTRIGVGTRLRQDARGTRLVTVFIMDGTSC
jgi:hypothetical protein